MPEARRASTVMNAADGELRNIVDASERRAVLAGIVVIAGVVLELVLAFAVNEPLSLKVAMGIADALVALGVAGELFFGRRGTSAQAELGRRTELALAGAIERAANAERETERIKLLTAWRHLPPKIDEMLASVIGETASNIDLLVEYQTGDPEAFGYACEFMEAFSKAGVTKLRHCGNSFVSAPVFGVLIASSEPITVDPIISVFANANVVLRAQRADLATHLPRNLTPPNLYIFVLPRPPNTPPPVAAYVNPMEHIRIIPTNRPN